MKYAKILGTGSYLPANRVSNDDLAQKVDTSDEWITSRTGIKFRHIAADNEQTSDLAVAAARRARSPPRGTMVAIIIEDRGGTCAGWSWVERACSGRMSSRGCAPQTRTSR